MVLPSLLSCDFANLERQIGELKAAGVKALHLDVMDGNFVPNLTFSMLIVEAVRRLTDLTLDVHLMIEDPGRYVRQFRDAGADVLTIHVEAVDDPRPVLQRIRDLNVPAGVALNPGTPLSDIEGCLDLCDLALVMSVEAGFGGQEFMPVAFDKLRRLREIAGEDLLLEVDGGVNRTTVADCTAAGAQLLVIGSAFFQNSNYSMTLGELTGLAKRT